MASGFTSFEIARSGLVANERALYVTGHNISNVNTKGYTRQQAIISEVPPQNMPWKSGVLQTGLGTDIQQIRQIRHIFLDGIFRQENNIMGYWESRNKTFEDIEAILGEPMEEGIQTSLNEFWDAWHELSKEPESLAMRAYVAQRGEALISRVNAIGSQLDRLQNDINTEISVRIDEVNEILRQIADLNVEVLKNELNGDSANDFRDQRNLLIDRLSKLANVDIFELDDGQVNVQVGGCLLVYKGIYKNISVETTAESGQFYVPMIEGTDIEVPINNGIIKGLMEARGEVLGVEGSLENGTPNTKADIVFAIDVSNTSAVNLNKIQTSIATYIQELNACGTDYNLRLVTYDGTGVIDDNDYGDDTVTFSADIGALAATGNAGNDFGSVVSAIDAMTFRDDANKFSLVFTDESVGGDGNVIADPVVDGYINTLSNKGVKTSVITDTSYYNNGDIGERGWDSITEGTSGRLYDIDTDIADYGTLMTSINNDVNTDVNTGISVIYESNNIIPDLKSRLNALVNIMARELNYLHRSGRTLDNNPGEDFFVAIDSTRPLEMGNIKLNDNLSDLDNIVSSLSGGKGDNIIAQRIANLRNDNSIMQDINGVFDLDEYYQSIILATGNSANESKRIFENQSELAHSADNKRKSIADVSMDEELTNMLKYKFAYDASSRAINVIDSMLDRIINKMGITGR